MFCTNCGKTINDDAKFCIYCGVMRNVVQAQPTNTENVNTVQQTVNTENVNTMQQAVNTANTNTNKQATNNGYTYNVQQAGLQQGGAQAGNDKKKKFKGWLVPFAFHGPFLKLGWINTVLILGGSAALIVLLLVMNGVIG